MKHQHFPKLIKVSVPLLAVFLTACTAFSGPSNKWRIEFSESAKSNGNLVFRLAPEDEEYIDVDIQVFKGTSENQVANRVKNELQEKLPAGKYAVEVDDGEDVLIRTRWGEPDFRINLVSNTVDSVRIGLDRE
jgi:hypothetical protein